ncbi:hypothetical protein NG798_24395 [Ancylothrix sp. C2]|uniref:hypothetical protein n=1 Tax=Ancylothrix sp. D3o TaxID=2953691 RepID=UPI0021BB958F|nr:hypothetical protein [Ancylothrix sp. D3o]MCT7952942.1 hypothetical protein [Ancylothrix sp. D3o]
MKKEETIRARATVDLGDNKEVVHEMAESEARTLSSMTRILLFEALELRQFLMENNFRERLLLQAGREKNVISAIKKALTEWLEDKEKPVKDITLVGAESSDLSNFSLSKFTTTINNHRLDLVDKGVLSSVRAEQLAAGQPPTEEEIKAVAQAFNLTTKELCNQC